jgi:hypothetical protein
MASLPTDVLYTVVLSHRATFVANIFFSHLTIFNNICWKVDFWSSSTKWVLRTFICLWIPDRRITDPSGPAVAGVGLWPLAYRDRGFESHRGHGYGSVVCVVRLRSLRRADHLSRWVLPTVARRCVWSRNLVDEEAIARAGLQCLRKQW